MWVRACAVTDLPAGEVLKVDAVCPPLALFNVDGDFFATDDTCSHAESSLSEGWLEGDVVECVWHFAKFCVRTGKVLSLPATSDIRTYPTRVQGDEVFVEVGET
jgi:3-phenylpropionate/trans-cinnamate dioxygenase ferredoxin component